MSEAIHDSGKASSERRTSLALPSAKERRLTQAALSLSIANLSFVWVWGKVSEIASDPLQMRANPQLPHVELVWALIFDVVIFAAIIFAGFELIQARKRGLRLVGILIVAISSAFALIHALHGAAGILYDHNLGIWVSRGRPVVAGIALVVAVVALRRPRVVLRAIKGLFLILAPAPFIFSANTLWAYHEARVHFPGSGTAAGMLPSATNSKRVVWLIFDELDARLLFQVRPRSIHIPEFERLRSESLTATQTTSPAHDTEIAIPSFLTGKFVSDQKATSFSDLEISECNGKSAVSVPFESQPNIFKRLRKEGFNAGVTGWALPYCRMMGSYLSDCAWDMSGFSLLFVQRELHFWPFYKQALYLAWWQSRVLPFVGPRLNYPPDDMRLSRAGMIKTLDTVETNAIRMVRNPKLNMVYIHLPVPHLPAIWDSRRQALTTGESSYLENLELADAVLGRIRRELEATGQWDQTTVLVSADHPFRPMWSDWHANEFADPQIQALTQGKWHPFVPFLLKLPNQHHEQEYTRSFNSIISGDLLLAVLEDKIHNPDEAVKWLDTHAEAHPGTETGICIPASKTQQ